MHYLFPVIGYLIGSVSAAILVCKVAGLPDPRTQGSGNPGATNVLRVGGKGPAAITLLGDAAKGLIPVLAAMLIGIPPLWVGLTALAAVLGHLFPVFFQFRGGKGVATSFGAIFGISWLAGLLTIASWLAISLTFRYSSLAALTSMVLVPLYLWITTRSMALAVCGALIGVLIFWRHRANIARLLNGTEPKIGDKSKS
jgi:glycerol-3-phosphate acyltransferase PlsY